MVMMDSIEHSRNDAARRARAAWRLLGASGSLAALVLAVGCAANGADDPQDNLQAVIGSAGGELTGAKGTPFEGVHLVIPPNALSGDTHIEIAMATNAPALPATAKACGPMFELRPAGLKLAVPAELTLPFDPNVVSDNFRFSDEVKTWGDASGTWGQHAQVDSTDSSVTVEINQMEIAAAGVNPPQDVDVVRFKFAPNPAFFKCLAADPNDADHQPTVEATIVRGDLNDGLFLRGENIKPGLAFDMFTVQNSSLDADGNPIVPAPSFGLAWYQSDLEANGRGRMRAEIRTVLLDQIFGFDPVVGLGPTNTFHVGFWFNNPKDAVDCGFNPDKPTPFNGEHQAGPLAMITLPDATTGLGPLCTKPDTSVRPARCNP